MQTRNNSPEGSARYTVWELVASGALVTMALLLPLRARILGMRISEPANYLLNIPSLLSHAYQDVACVGIAALIFAVFAFVLRRGRQPPKWWSRAYMATLIVILFAGTVNVPAVHLLGGPINIQWMKYADLTGSALGLRSILGELSIKLVLTLILGPVALIMLTRWLTTLMKRRPIRAISTVLLCLAPLYVVSAQIASAGQREPAGYGNALFHFAGSIFFRRTAVDLFTAMEDKAFTDTEPEVRLAGGSTFNQKNLVRNVLLVVFESVPVRYVGLYGSGRGVTPNLDSYADQAAIFRNIRVHVPQSIKSFVSILCSVYPSIDDGSLIEDHPDLPVPCLSNELKRHGYRTSFLTTSDNSFHGIGEFLEHRGFDHIADYASMECEGAAPIDSILSYPYLGGTDDKCLVPALTQWLDANPGLPFFTIAWTVMTHMPYYTPGNDMDFGTGDRHLNRFLNALRHGDLVLGQMIEVLKERGLFDSTLVVVLGDHGEAFGEHGVRGHAFGLYEETLNVPLVLLNPAVFAGEVHDELGGIIDVAPTVLDVLGFTQPQAWHGRSLFSAQRTNAVYAFTPYGEYYRFVYYEGNLKLIYDPIYGNHEVYDLATDPKEEINLGKQEEEFIARGTRRLAGWVKSQLAWERELKR